MYLKSDILFYVFHVVCGLHYDTHPSRTRTSSGMCRSSRFLISVFIRSFFRFLRYVLKIGYIILCFSRSVRITLRHRKVVYSNSILLIPLPPLSRRVHQRCRGIPHGCVEMGQDDRVLEPRNQGSEGKDSEGHVGTETVGRQRRVGGERESRALLARHGHAQSGTRRATLVK